MQLHPWQHNLILTLSANTLPFAWIYTPKPLGYVVPPDTIQLEITADSLQEAAGFAFQGKETTIFKSSLFAEFVKLLKLIYFYTDLYLIELPEINL